MSSIIRSLADADPDPVIRVAATGLLAQLAGDDGATQAIAGCRLINRLHDAGRPDSAGLVATECAKAPTSTDRSDADRYIAEQVAGCHNSRLYGPRPVDVMDGAA